jgi:hypothetical protein
MIIGRNPFALPLTPLASTATVQQNYSVQQLEKRNRIQQIIERVLRVDWSVPSHVIIEDALLELLLEQLLNGTPRKRSTARSILNCHPFLNIISASTTARIATAPPSMAGMNKLELSGIEQCACRGIVSSKFSTNGISNFSFTNAISTSSKPASSQGMLAMGMSL